MSSEPPNESEHGEEAVVLLQVMMADDKHERLAILDRYHRAPLTGLVAHHGYIGAGTENRTPDICLEGRCFTT